ncbi:lipase family protein [Gordonia crocea]|uniref:Putative inactive lipase n=1 Tax=Gordonia crocea TaxID=589162 RepID=A0A7I9UUP0_9ACTN|nr:lipase family protein [Gordonia crocea]GED96765.1 putative inactive lipase [Gordonia crocea]
MIRSTVTAFAAATAGILALGVLAAPATAAPHTPPNRTPQLGEVFNGYVVGTFGSGRLAGPGEIFAPLVSGDPFYAEPRLTGTEKPGTLLKAKKVAVQFTGFRPGNVDAYKLMYVTTGLRGAPEISTGIVMIPRDGKRNDQRKVIGYQFANDSVGAYCHPSTMWTGGDPMDGASWSALGPLAQMFGKGYAVAISDVGNDGDRRPHGVFAGKFAGNAMSDMLRATLGYARLGLNPKAPVGLFGIAGGGVGAAFAAENAADYAPDLDIRSTVLEGMVVNQRNFIRTASGSVGSGFAFATLLGLEPKYPEMKIDDHLNPAGKALADVYRTQCQTPAYFTLPYVPLQALFTGNRHPADIKAFQRVYRDNLLGRKAPASRVLIASCAADDSPMSLVPAADSRRLARSYRSRGTKVAYHPTDCSMVKMLTDMYGWGTDLFGMQTIDWLDWSLRAPR